MDSLSLAHTHKKKKRNKKKIVFVQSRKRKELDTAGRVLAAGHTIRIKGGLLQIKYSYMAIRSRNRLVSNFSFSV